MGQRHLLAVAAFFVSTVAVYSVSLTGPWAFDDVVGLRHSVFNTMRDLVGYRRIAYATFFLNQKIAPSLDPVWFRLFNVLLHVVNAALVYALTYRTITIHYESAGPAAAGTPRGHERMRAFYAALMAGLVFSLHPININAVAYIIQRMASLAAMFVLLSLLAYVSAVRARGAKRVLMYLVSLTSLAAGIFSKENALLATPLILLYDYAFLSRSDRRAFLIRAGFLGGIALVAAGTIAYVLGIPRTFASILQTLSSPNTPITAQGWTATDVWWTPLQHVLTEFRVICRYMFLLVLPLPRFLVFDWWGYPLSTGMTSPATTLPAAGLVLLLLLFSFWKMRRLPFLCFGILWYLAALSLESFLAVGSDLYFEHRNYLPFAGLLIGLFGQAAVSYREKLRGRHVMAAAAVLCLALAGLTVARNLVWKDSVTLWSDTVEKAPSNLRAVLALGNTYVRRAELGRAEGYYREVVERSNQAGHPYFLDSSAFSLGMLYLFDGDLGKAGGILALYGKGGSPHHKILSAYYDSQKGETDKAIAAYRGVIPETSGQDRVTVQTLLGDALRTKSSWDEALKAYGAALESDPSFAAARYGIGAAYMGKGDLGRAEQELGQALNLDPDHVLALADMADVILIRGGDAQTALSYAGRAVSKTPPFYQPYLAMATALETLGRDREAEDYFARAREHRAPAYMIPYARAKASYLKKDKEGYVRRLKELRSYELPERLRVIVSGELRSAGAQ